jgi:hypothetical protein
MAKVTFLQQIFMLKDKNVSSSFFKMVVHGLVWYGSEMRNWGPPTFLQTYHREGYLTRLGVVKPQSA